MLRQGQRRRDHLKPMATEGPWVCCETGQTRLGKHGDDATAAGVLQFVGDRLCQRRRRVLRLALTGEPVEPSQLNGDRHHAQTRGRVSVPMHNVGQRESTNTGSGSVSSLGAEALASKR